MIEMTDTQRRAYGIGKDARAIGEDLDTNIDWAVAEGIVPDTYTTDLYARMGWAAA